MEMDSGNTSDSYIYISVILPLRLEWEPCYRLPVRDRETRMPAGIGERVRVMFAGKEYIGVISGYGIEPDIEKSRIKDVSGTEAGLERINIMEIGFWRQVAAYYMCTVGEVYKAAYPSQKTSSEEAVARRNSRLEKRRTAVLEAAIRKLMMLKARQEKSVKILNTRNTALKARIDRKSLLLAKDGKDSDRQKHIREIGKLRNAISENDAEIARIQTDIERIDTETAELDARKSGRKDTGTDDTGHLEKRSLQVPDIGFTLSPDQQKALEDIKSAFSSRKTVLLKGVTGSGKTEIYMKLAQEVLYGGKNVLYLIPEIALGKQLEERLEKTFGEKLLAFHSGQTHARRAEVSAVIHDVTGKQEKGDAESSYMVIGTRSAVFLPHRNLGLIIVDEEHDSSYKQGSPAPRYNGRDAGIILGSIHSCPVLLGSATPSLESLYNCRTGKYSMVELTRKYHGAPDAEVEIIDTVAERKKNGMRGSFSLKLIFRIKEALDRGEQVIILRSRRSYSPVVQCTECGYIPKCPHCNVSLSYHKSSGKEICHYCGYSSIYTGKCPECGGRLTGLGAGTQKIEEEVADLFPQARVARLDSDSAHDRKFESEVIRSFSRGETDILIGTQMVTKGFDFSGLTLVAVIGADSLLAQQDFRADEKAVQILGQFRGRCGRRGHKGRFIIQTCQPEHPVYKMIANDGKMAWADLLRERHDFGYPPFCRIIDISVKDTYEDRADRMAGILCKELASGGFSFTGPFTPYIGKDMERHIRGIRVSLAKDSRLSLNKAMLQKTLSDFEKRNGYTGHIVIDVDPY